MLDSRKAFAYFTSKFALKRSTNNWFTFHCPHCGKHKAAVHFDFEVVKCWVCSYKHSIVDWVADFEGLDFRETLKMLWAFNPSGVSMNMLEAINIESVKKAVDIKLPVGYKPLLYGDTMLANRARNYLADRNLDLNYLGSLGLGYVNEHDTENESLDYFGYIILPFNTPKGDLYYYIGRDYTGNFLRYKNPPVTDFGIGKSELLFNEQGLNRKTTVIVEGSFCAATIGKSGVASLGKDLSTKQISKILNSDCENVVICYDKGAYEDGIKAGMKLLDYKKVYVVNLNLYNGAEDQKDPNAIGKDETFRLIADTPELTLSTALDALI